MSSFLSRRSADPRNPVKKFTKAHPEMGYRACLGIIRLAQQYSAQRVEAAAQRALLAKACRYQSVKYILKNSLHLRSTIIWLLTRVPFQEFT